ncbi:MAG TPA: reverse transcriptase domain-containing protein [Clostridia bacterium]|jgi:RNA-directed DNA polymerase|nr:reverse transcriptase domain-containing protein [Clostridia bacterium]HQO56312.1 reverse transcriptase domain-containing protein [Clostridia bacterium]HUM61811.1 reverse transcriptase domain-containing protein [Clostridia bacterium]
MTGQWKNYKRNKINRFNRSPEMLSIYLPLAEAYAAKPDEYVREHAVIIQGRRRRIVTYRIDKKGAQLRLFHQRIAAVIQYRYQSCDNSYAYKKNRGILDCLYRHLDSTCFLKTDIHSYFDSVRFEDLLTAAFRSPVLRHHSDMMRTLLSACFYEGRLPIGFVSSPVLSDLYLVKLDRKMSTIEGMVYTRYADDFLLSVQRPDQKLVLEEALVQLVGALQELGLETNRKKTYYRTMAIPGDAIHVLGLNLVRQDGKPNRITVSDRYLRKISLLAGELKENRAALCDEEVIEKFNRLAGQISFVNYASMDSAVKLTKMLAVKLGYTGNLDIKSLSSFLRIPIPEFSQSIRLAVK